MNTYTRLKMLVENRAAGYRDGSVPQEEWENFKTVTLQQMDTFLLCRRITNDQYKALFELLDNE